jgi:hypothetical protein
MKQSESRRGTGGVRGRVVWLLRALGPDGSSDEVTARVNPGAMTEVILKLGASMSPESDAEDN